jgi:hypothetical protein
MHTGDPKMLIFKSTSVRNSRKRTRIIVSRSTSDFRNSGGSEKPGLTIL